MRFIIPLTLAFLVLGGGFGLTFLYKFLNDADTSISLDGGNENVNPFATALKMMIEDSAGAVTDTPDLDISNLLPEAREGWFRKEYVNADGEALTGREIIHSAVVKSTSNSMLLRFETDSKNRRGHHAYTYMRGDLRVIVRARLLEQLNENTVRGGLMAQVTTNMAGVADAIDGQGPDRRFAVMDDIAFIEAAPFNYIRLERRGVPTDYRVFNADIHGFVDIQIMTNASDNAVAETIKSLDIASILAQMGQEPQVAGFTTHLPQPLSKDRPPTTPGQAAFALLNSEHGLAENEIRTMRKISAGDIETREQLRETVGSGSHLSQTFRDFIAAHPLPPRSTYVDPRKRMNEAAKVIDDIPRAAPSEFVLLHMIRTGQVTHYDEAKTFFPHIHTMQGIVTDLLEPSEETQVARNDVPSRTIVDANGRGASETRRVGDSNAATTPRNERPAVRRMTGSSGLSGVGTCTLVDGVRRCMIDGN